MRRSAPRLSELLTAPRRQHVESTCLKNGLLKLSQRLGVFHQKDAFRTAQFFSESIFCSATGRLTRMSREIDLKAGAFSWRAIHPISLLCFTMPYTVASPSPVPLPRSLVVKNGSKHV